MKLFSLKLIIAVLVIGGCGAIADHLDEKDFQERAERNVKAGTEYAERARFCSEFIEFSKARIEKRFRECEELQSEAEVKYEILAAKLTGEELEMLRKPSVYTCDFYQKTTEDHLRKSCEKFARDALSLMDVELRPIPSIN